MKSLAGDRSHISCRPMNLKAAELQVPCFEPNPTGVTRKTGKTGERKDLGIGREAKMFYIISSLMPPLDPFMLLIAGSLQSFVLVSKYINSIRKSFFPRIRINPVELM